MSFDNLSQDELENKLEEGLEAVKEPVSRYHEYPVTLAHNIWPMFREVNKKLSEEEILDTVQFATKWHYGQPRHSGNPYILHPAQVAYFMAFNQLPDEPVQGGLLHDVLEKNSKRWHTLSNSIYKRYDELVHIYVEAMSTKNRPGNPSVDSMTEEKKQRIDDFSETFGLDCLKVLKLADNAMNMRSRKYLPGKNGMTAPEFQQSQVDASKKHYLPMAEDVDKLNMLPMKLKPYMEKIYEKY